MDAQQLDSLLKSKVNRSRSAKRVSRVAAAVLCLLLIVGSGVGIYYLANREPQEASETTEKVDFSRKIWYNRSIEKE